MITSASGYECLNVTNPDLSGFITGDILPVRDNRGDGSWRAMRYEDLLFLQEAMAEREWAIRDDSIVVSSPKPRRIDDYNFKNCVNRTYDKYVLNIVGGITDGYYIDKDKSPVFNFTRTNATNIRDALSNLGYGFSDPEQDITHKNITADDVRMAFYRTKKYVRTVHYFTSNNTPTITATEDKYIFYASSGSPTHTTETIDWNIIGNYPLYYQSVRSTSITIGSRSYRYSSFSYSNPPSFRWPKQYGGPVIPQCYWLFLVEVDDWHPGSSHTYNRFLVTKSAGNTSFSSFGVSGIASTAANLAMVPYSDEPYETPESANHGVSIYVKEMAGIMDHTFPAEIDTLNWNWQPSTI